MENDIKDQIPSVKPIPITLFSRRANKTTQLVNNAVAEFTLEGMHRWFDFDFEEIIFVRSIAIHTTGYDNWDRVEFEIKHSSENTIIKAEKPDVGVYTCQVEQTCLGFRFRPGAKFSLSKNQKINQVIVQGYTLSELTELEGAIAKIDSKISDIDSQQQRLDTSKAEADEKFRELAEKTEALRQEGAELNKTIGSAKSEIDGIIKEKTANELKLTDLGAKLKDEMATLNSRQNERRKIVSEIEENTLELTRIRDKIKLFPSEISGFVEEGSRNIKIYMLLAFPFVAVIFYVTYSLFTSAINLSHIDIENNAAVWSVILTRIPFVTVAVSILQVCGFVVGRFIYEIVQINKQRLNLSKLSIVAKDVSAASAAGLDLTPEEKFEMETYLKMELLREHIKQYVGTGFSYKGGKIADLMPEWRKKKKDNQRNNDTDEDTELDEIED